MPELKAQTREVWRLSLPAILTQITTIAMQYIDSAMVGALGANASASIGLVSTSTWLIGGIIGGVSAGFSVQASHRIGGGVVGTAQRRFLLALFQQLAKTVKIDPRNIRGQPVGQPGTRWL